MSPAEAPVVLLDWPLPRVARLRINRPDKRNAIDHAVRQQLGEAVDAVAQLTELTDEQAEYIGVPKAGPYKPDSYRY